MGLVGPNGAGKSTLFSLILGESSPDEGKISIQKSATVGFLPQENAPAGEETVLELACGIKHGSKMEHDHELDWEIEPKAKRILAGLAFRESDFDRPAKTMSGGWVMRAHLARLLVQEPDLLLLDEPTNHLDLESLLWFQEYLKNYPGAILMISHDREFLNNLVGAIVEIAHRRLHRYRGNYDSYVEQKRRAKCNSWPPTRTSSARSRRCNFRGPLSRQGQQGVAGAKQAQADRADGEDRGADRAGEDGALPFSAAAAQRSTRDHAERCRSCLWRAGGLSRDEFPGGARPAHRAGRPERRGQINVAEILGGVLPITHGTRELGHNVKVGYFSQYRVEMLNPKQTVLEEALDTPNPVSEQTARTVLGSFLFRGDDVFKVTSVLSGGEKSRLALVKLLLDPPNLLLMDEPTTHLDIGSIDALVGALSQYEGTLIFISHDVYFIRALAKTVLHVNAGKLTPYAGDYQYYLEKSEAVSARAALTSNGEKKLHNAQPAVEHHVDLSREKKKPGMRETREARRAEADRRKMEAKAKREREKRLHDLTQHIISLEVRQKELTAELEKPDTYNAGGAVMQLNRELLAVTEDLARVTEEWEGATLSKSES